MLKGRTTAQESWQVAFYYYYLTHMNCAVVIAQNQFEATFINWTVNVSGLYDVRN